MFGEWDVPVLIAFALYDVQEFSVGINILELDIAQFLTTQTTPIKQPDE